jgi:hypothetical protein
MLRVNPISVSRPFEGFGWEAEQPIDFHPSRLKISAV